jgi:hypothetical protein
MHYLSCWIQAKPPDTESDALGHPAAEQSEDLTIQNENASNQNDTAGHGFSLLSYSAAPKLTQN